MSHEELRSSARRCFRKYDFLDEFPKLSPNEARKRLKEKLGDRCERFSEMQIETIIFSRYPSDHERPLTVKPSWYDADKFEKGQAFARDHLAGLFLAQLYGLVCVFCHDDGLRALIMTQRSHTPYLAFIRYLSTMERVRNWFTDDPWQEGTRANKDILTVRRMHQSARKKLCECDDKEFDANSTINNPYCPALSILRDDFSKNLPADTFNELVYTEFMVGPNNPRSINQLDMSYTLFGFMGLPLLFPNRFGIYPSDEDLENFLHVWRTIGYLLGVDDDINFCRGTLDDVKQRSRNYLDVTVIPAFQNVTPNWEHMMRCVISGFNYFLPLPNFQAIILHLTEMLNIEMPGLYASLTYSQWVKYKLGDYFLRYGMRLTALRNIVNKIFNIILDKILVVDKTRLAKFKEESMKTMLHVSVGT